MTGTIVSLVVTVAWESAVGWLFLACFLASFASSVVGRVQHERWLSRARGDTAPLRLNAPLRVARVIALVVGGVAGAYLATRFGRPRYVVYPGFVVGGWLANLAVVFSALVWGRIPYTAERSATSPEHRLESWFAVAASTLVKASPAEPGWEHVVARCVSSSYEAGRAAALAADPRLAMRLTLKREHLRGAGPEAAIAWAEVIDATRRGIADGQEARNEPTRQAGPAEADSPTP